MAESTKQKIYLVKKGQKEITFEVPVDPTDPDNTRIVTLFDGKRHHLKRYPGEYGTAIMSVVNFFPRRECSVDFLITYETFDEMFKFSIKFGENQFFEGDLIKLSARDPILSIKGSLVLTHMDGQPLRKRRMMDFIIPELRKDERMWIDNVECLEELGNTAKKEFMMECKYDIVLEWTKQ